ncbi:MAG TPA: hypothetical protein VKS82_17905 [Streptosporangiaceae bacterium]|nr:hypothetical protein [Streptosporangiaceae bacterium]
MTSSSTGRIPGDPATVRRSTAARRVSRIIGLTLAAIAAAVMYVTLFRTSASPARTPASPSRPSANRRAASHTAIALHQRAEFAAGSGTLDPIQFDPIRFDPRGTIVVAMTGSSQISAWSTSNGQQLTGFAAMPGGTSASSSSLSSPAFSPDGKEFSVINAGYGGGVADVWNMATGQATPVPLPLVSSSYTANYAVPGPDGLIADSYGNGTLGLVATATGQPEVMLPLNRGAGIGYQISEPVFSPDGQTVAVSDDLGMLHLLNVPAKRLIAALRVEKIYNVASPNGMSSLDVDSIVFSPDSTRVACGTESGIVRVWDVASGQNVSTFSVNGSAPGDTDARPVKTLVFSPDGKLLVTADNADSTLAVWDVASGREVATVNAGGGKVASAAFTTNGTLIVATVGDSASGATIGLWVTGSKLGS